MNQPNIHPSTATQQQRDRMEAAYEYGVARCSRCGLMYEQSDAFKQCNFHPGTYGNHAGNTLNQTWSCCKSAHEFIRGCTTDTVHTRCQETADALASFPQVDGLETFRKLRREQEEAEKAEQLKIARARQEKFAIPDNAHRYTVGVGDTLASVALKHGMQVAHLKKFNKLLSPQLYPGQTLLVQAPKPPTEDELRSLAIKEVMKRTRCDKYEAAFYLDEHGGGTDVEAASAAHAIDSEMTKSGVSEDWVNVGKSKDL